MKLRGISEKMVFLTLHEPDKIELEAYHQLIYQKKLALPDKRDYLLRIFVNPDKDPKLVKTVYRTTKFSKYE